MFARSKLLLTVLLFVVLVSAVTWAAFAARAPVNGDEPITMTKAMYADLLCVAASEFEPRMGGFEFNYDPASDTVRVTYIARTNSTMGASVTHRDLAKEEASCKASLKERVDRRILLVLPKLQKNVSPAVSTAFVGF